MPDRVYVSRGLQDRIRALGRPIREFVRDALAERLAVEEARAKSQAPPTPPAIPAEPTPEEVNAIVAALPAIDFSDLGRLKPPEPAITPDPAEPVTEVPRDAAGRFAFGEPRESDLLLIARYVRRKRPTMKGTLEDSVALGRDLAEIARLNPITTDRSFIELRERELGRRLSGPARVAYLRQFRRRLGLPPRERVR